MQRFPKLALMEFLAYCVFEYIVIIKQAEETGNPNWFLAITGTLFAGLTIPLLLKKDKFII